MFSATVLRDFLRQNPILKPVIWFSSGLLLASVLVFPEPASCWLEKILPAWISLCAIVLIIPWQHYGTGRKSIYLSLLIVPSFFGLGLSAGQITAPEEEGLFLASVGECQDSRYGQRCQLRLRQRLDSNMPTRSNSAILLNLKSDTSLLKPGHQILVGLRIRAPQAAQHRSDFNERQWLLGMGLSGRAPANSNEVIILRQKQTVGGVCESLQARAVQAMAGSLQSDVATEILPALVLGEREFLSTKTQGSFRNIGIFHILAVSGMHVGLIFLMLHRTLGLFFAKKSLAMLLALIGVWTYAFCTGGSPSAMRAALLCTLYGIGLLLKRQSASWNALGCCFLLLLSVQPFLLHNIGFQLSFAAITGILALFRPVRALILPHGRISSFLWDVTALSIAAQAGSAPVSLFYFHQWPGAFLLGNLVAVPMAPVLLGAGSLLCMLGILGLPSRWLGSILDELISHWSGLIQSVELLSGPPVFAPAPAWSSLGLILLLLLFALRRHGKERFPPVSRKRRISLLLPLTVAILVGWALQHHVRALAKDRIALTWSYRSGYSCYGSIAGIPFQYAQKGSPISPWLNWHAQQSALRVADSSATLNRQMQTVLHFPGLLICQGRPPPAQEHVQTQAPTPLQTIQILSKTSKLADFLPDFNNDVEANYLLLAPDLSRYQRMYLKHHVPAERLLEVSRGRRIVFSLSQPGAAWQLER